MALNRSFKHRFYVVCTLLIVVIVGLFLADYFLVENLIFWSKNLRLRKLRHNGKFFSSEETSSHRNIRIQPFYNVNTTNQMIIVVTPTYKRITRIADMLRMANTLSHVDNLYWIVVEDGDSTVPNVRSILNRTNLRYTYMAHKTKEGYPRRGWFQRTKALEFIRENVPQILGHSHQEGVVYFGDDDNSYDIRLFDDYIRHVQNVGMWAVGLVGGVVVESPRVSNGKVVGFNVGWDLTDRQFAVDMAGFAVNLRVILNSEAVFGTSCERGNGSPETCLLEDLGLQRDHIEPFVCANKENCEILVWHTKTGPPNLDQVPKGGPYTYGYFTEISHSPGLPLLSWVLFYTCLYCFLMSSF